MQKMTLPIPSIQERRSIRKFTTDPVPNEIIEQMLEAARWAPSGLNNQPWRFSVVTDREKINETSRLTKYTNTVLGSAALIFVYYHLPSGYNRDKDMMAIGAAIQNMLLTAHASGAGTVWLGEILNQKDQAHQLYSINEEELELQAVIAVGIPAETPARSRKTMEELRLKDYH